MARRNGPTLYEVMTRVPPPAPKTDGDPRHRERDADRPPSTALLTPGRVVRIPVGYVWIAVGGLILLVVLAYIFGYSRGNRRAQAEAERISEGLQEKLAGGVQVADPLLEASELQTVEVLVAAPDASSAPPQAVSAPVSEDPLVPGRAYFIAETPLFERAGEIVDFIRAAGAEDGLDAAVIPAHNARFRRVIVLPGFEPSDARTRDQLRKLIIDLGRRYQRQGKNNDNFDDTYHYTYSGTNN
ncbi:MAG: hypothetical protein MK085_10565 [Phycisphaerales bacterium]|nr:hypothetical protein [Phycisphaerales bacterium]